MKTQTKYSKNPGLICGPWANTVTHTGPNVRKESAVTIPAQASLGARYALDPSAAATDTHAKQILWPGWN